MSNSMLKLNDDKTEYLIIGSRHVLNNIPDSIKVLNIGDNKIPAAESAHNIAVQM